MLSCATTTFPPPYEHLELPRADAPRDEQIRTLDTYCGFSDAPTPVLMRCCELLSGSDVRATTSVWELDAAGQPIERVTRGIKYAWDGACNVLARRAKRNPKLRPQVARVLAPFCGPASDPSWEKRDWWCRDSWDLVLAADTSALTAERAYASLAALCESHSYEPCKYLVDTFGDRWPARVTKTLEGYCAAEWFTRNDDVTSKVAPAVAMLWDGAKFSYQMDSVELCLPLAERELRGAPPLVAGRSYPQVMHKGLAAVCKLPSYAAHGLACAQAARATRDPAEAKKLRDKGEQGLLKNCEQGNCEAAVRYFKGRPEELGVLERDCRNDTLVKTGRQQSCQRWMTLAPTDANLEFACGRGVAEACQTIACKSTSRAFTASELLRLCAIVSVNPPVAASWPACLASVALAPAAAYDEVLFFVFWFPKEDPDAWGFAGTPLHQTLWSRAASAAAGVEADVKSEFDDAADMMNTPGQYTYTLYNTLVGGRRVDATITVSVDTVATRKEANAMYDRAAKARTEGYRGVAASMLQCGVQK